MSSRPPRRSGPDRQRRRVALERAREQEQSRRRKERTIRLLAVLAVLVVVAGGTVFALVRSRTSTRGPYPAAATGPGGGIVIGPKTGKVAVLDIYEDFQCPFCAAFEKASGPAIQAAAAAGKLRVVYHPVSFLGQESVRAANAAGCASDEGKYAAFHNALYAHQPAEGTGGYTLPDLINLGLSTGVSSASFAQCVTSMKYLGWVNAVQQNFDKSGYRGTPTVVLNGRQLSLTELQTPNFAGLLASATS